MHLLDRTMHYRAMFDLENLTSEERQNRSETSLLEGDAGGSIDALEDQLRPI